MVRFENEPPNPSAFQLTPSTAESPGAAEGGGVFSTRSAACTVTTGRNTAPTKPESIVVDRSDKRNGTDVPPPTQYGDQIDCRIAKPQANAGFSRPNSPACGGPA